MSRWRMRDDAPWRPATWRGFVAENIGLTLSMWNLTPVVGVTAVKALWTGIIVGSMVEHALWTWSHE